MVLTGRCYERESVPFKALDAVVDSLARYWQSLSELEAGALLPRDIAALAQLFPTLRIVKAVADAPSTLKGLDNQQVRKRAFLAMRELLLRISDRARLILVIDDLQWGDAESAELLADVLTPPHEPPVMFIGTCRTDEVESGIFLQRFQSALPDLQISQMEVGPFSEEECLALANALQHDHGSSDDVKKVLAESGGNPFLLRELLTHNRSIDVSESTEYDSRLDGVIDSRLGCPPG